MDEVGRTIVALLVFAFIFGGFRDSPRYQVESYGSKGVIVLDVKTGEVWTRKENSNGHEYLSPMNYELKQYSNQDFGMYNTPEGTRDDKNISWFTYIERKFQSAKKKTK